MFPAPETRLALHASTLLLKAPTAQTLKGLLGNCFMALAYYRRACSRCAASAEEKGRENK